MAPYDSSLPSVNPPGWDNLAPVKVQGCPVAEAGVAVIIPTDAGDIRISFYADGMRLRVGTQRPLNYGMLKAEPEPIPVSTQTEGEQSEIQAGPFRLLVEHTPFSFALYTGDKLVQRSATDGHFVRRHRLPPLARTGEGWFFALDLQHDEPVFGLGEKWGPLNRRGQLLRSCNHDALGVNAEISYKNIPFCWSPAGWGVFVHTPSPVTHAVGCPAWSQRSYGLLVEDSSADIFLFYAGDGANMLARYTALTGRAPVPPDWSLGVILSRAYYRTADEILDAAKKVREAGMPCDVITFDGRAWQDTATRFAFEWDASRYPDPAAVIARLKAQNFRVCIWEYPLISVQNPLFEELAQKGWLLRDRRTGEAFRYSWDMSAFGEVLTPLPDSGILDFTHPEARDFWRDSHKPLFDMGVDMIKADFGEQVEHPDMLAHNGESGSALRNVYALLYNRTVYEAAQRYCQSGAFLFSRAAWTGSQCYPSQWGGDPQADWGGLAASLRGGLSWGLSGGPFYATDVGGFYKDTRDAELYVRWTQLAIFAAHIRLHGIGPREPFSYGEQAASAANQALRLRYRLLPYIRLVMQQAHDSGLPAQRAMVLACPEDPAAWAFEHQFFFGNDLLVAPCLQPGGRVRFYLPAGRWRRFPDSDNALWDGGQCHELLLPLDATAVFVRDGVRIPLGPDMQYTDQLPPDEQHIAYWPDQ